MSIGSTVCGHPHPPVLLLPGKTPRFDGIILDLDGTLTRPTLDFAAIRREIGIGADDDLVERINILPSDRRIAAWAIVERHEEEARRRQVIQPGARELLEHCRLRGVRTAVVTRNTRRSVETFCARYEVSFDTVVTREFPFIKPHPGPIQYVLAQWKMTAERVLTVGDYIHDIASGRAAGTLTCHFRNPGCATGNIEADFSVKSMGELWELVFPDEACGDVDLSTHLGT